MAVTQKDIARHLNIDPSAVSYALKDTGTGSAATRRQIREAARKLDYRPNILARGMRTGKTGTIGVLMGGDFQKLAGQLRQIEESARLQGYHVLTGHGVSDVRYAPPEDILETEINQLDQFMRFQVDGLVVQTATIYLSDKHQKEYWDRVRRLVPEGHPVVAFDSPGDHGFAQISVDRFQWGQEAARNLRDLGYQNLLYVGSKKTFFSRQLYRGLQSVARLRCKVLEAEVTDDKSVFEGHRAAGSFEKGRAQVLVAANARIAHGLLIGLMEKGVRVPQDVSLVALDSSEILEWPPCPISSFEYRSEQLAQGVWQMMIQQLEGGNTNRKNQLGFSWGGGETLKENIG